MGLRGSITFILTAFFYLSSISVTAQPLLDRSTSSYPTIMRLNQPLTPDKGVNLARVAVTELELKPSPDSDVELLEVRATLFSDGGLRLDGTTLVYENDIIAFHIEADIKLGVYKTTYFTKEELNEVRQSQSYIEASREYDLQNRMLTNTYTAFIQMLSEDGIGIDLAKTTGGVDWTDDGTNVTTLNATAAFWAATTPLFNTHWFISSASSGTTVPYNVPTTLNSLFGEGHYYNYDFWDNDKITTVGHAVNLDIYPKLPSGQVGTITWGFDDGGENSWFIVHDIFWTVF